MEAIVVFCKCVCLLMIMCVVTLAQPGMKTRITQAGIDFLTDSAQILTLLPDIPEFADSTKITMIGKVDYRLKNIKIKHLNISPKSFISVESGYGLAWKCRQVSVTLTGQWHYDIHGIIPVSDDGKFDVKVNLKSTPFKLKIGADEDGHLTASISDEDCHFKTGDIEVDIHGDGSSWFYGLFETNIEKTIKTSLDSEICPALLKLIQEDLATMLAKMTVVAPIIPSVAEIDLSLSADPSLKSFIDIEHRGAVYDVDGQTEDRDAPISPPSIPHDADEKQMIYVWLTDYVLNTAGLVLHDRKYFSFNLTQDQIPENSTIVLNTSSYEVSLLLPQVSKLYPNTEIQCNMYSTEAPELTVAADSVTGTLMGNIVVYAKDQSLTHLFTMNTNIYLSATFDIQDNDQLTWNLETFSCECKLANCDVEGFDFEIVRSAIDFTCHAFIKQYIKDLGEEGLPIPELPGDFQFINPTIKQGEGFLKIGVDLER